jgi:hypothetical protein
MIARENTIVMDRNYFFKFACAFVLGLYLATGDFYHSVPLPRPEVYFLSADGHTCLHVPWFCSCWTSDSNLCCRFMTCDTWFNYIGYFLWPGALVHLFYKCLSTFVWAE